jgi:hypothetical protein
MEAWSNEKGGWTVVVTYAAGRLASLLWAKTD